ncbi:MAG: biotin/lipoyl-binding protein, partial [Deltaproteobacteria bacterium]|nr:biotin/lipoyl-binding protein [Deltaproteobacteria bacterium]
MAEEKSAEHAGELLDERDGPVTAPKGEAPIVQPATGKPAEKRPLWIWITGGVVVVLALFEGIPWVVTALRTVSTDDAYVSGHVTFVAARVPGQVVRVLVDDNNRVHKGDLLVELDKAPYQVKVDIAQAALGVAQAALVTAQAKVHGLAGLARSEMFDLTHAMEGLNNQV